MSTAAALTHICHRRQSAAVSTQRQCCNPRRKDAGFFIERLSKLTHFNDFWDVLNPEKNWHQHLKELCPPHPQDVATFPHMSDMPVTNHSPLRVQAAINSSIDCWTHAIFTSTLSDIR